VALLPDASKAFENGLTSVEPFHFRAAKLLRVYCANKFLGIGKVDENGRIVPKRGFNA
jgi:hypothetical protein